MISVEKALELIKKYAEILENPEFSTVANSLNRILAEDIYAPFSLPPFRQSIMDGYALRKGKTLIYKIVGEIKTGDSCTFTLEPGEAIRVFTGAQVPETADMVVMQENVKITNEGIQLAEKPKDGINIRNIGDQIEKGNISLIKGETLNPSAIGILQSFGMSQVQVFRKPKITVISTGNELVEIGKSLEKGQIYESNSLVLKSVLKQKGIKIESIKKVQDSLKETEIAIEQALENSDIVLISGGISVGDYDFVGAALHNLGVKEIFYKVLQKPGKPIFFGKKDNKYVFALPGNPASTLTCLYVYVFSLIDLIMGKNEVGLTKIQFPLSENLENLSGRALFLKAKLQGNEVQVLNQQNSSILISFARADALVYIPSDCKEVKKGELVTTILLPFGR
ncbi:MAG: molybdopterin molybdotransferase MoeA [Chryseobacterium sp.]|nr:molybdopterin molybdotransferase MoeA [Chryseobacterium sp.]